MAKGDCVPTMPLKDTSFVLKRAISFKIPSVLIRSVFFAAIVSGTTAQLLTDVRKPKGPMTMVFYMYHAPESPDEDLQNSVAGDLPGLMWKIHNEVAASPNERHTAKRIVRYKVTMRAAERLHDERHRQFGPFVTFQSGKCMERACDNIWNQYGFNIGCQTVNTSDFAYYSPFVTRLGGGACPPNCNDGLWFSIPGNCPSMSFDGKTQDCNLRMPGGLCNDVHLLGMSGASCTFFIEDAGEITLSELVGSRSDFWSGRHDRDRCASRMREVQRLFRLHYPNMPETYGVPPCDAP
jgi:hypothetical protein